MWDLVKQLDANFGQALAVRLPPFAEQSKTVVMLAANYAQAEAIEQVATYSTLADDLSQQLVLFKSAQIAHVHADVNRIVASGGVLDGWVTVGAIMALVLIGPFSLMITTQIVRRLKRMTATMDRLAGNDTNVHVSGAGYRDELGEMARAMGPSIALDDFGMGYASLSYLRSFPFDKNKIDQSFIRDLPSQSECVAIVRAVTDLGSCQNA